MTLNKKALATVLLTLGLVSPALAATKTYDVERIHIQILGDIPGRGWLFMEDVKGVRSSLGFVVLGDDGSVIYNCHVIRIGRDFNIVTVGTFAQQATAHTTTGFMGTGGGAPCGTAVTAVDVSCPYAGVPAAQAFDHQTINQSGTYRTTNDLVSSYKITGHRDRPDFCAINITWQTHTPTMIETRVQQFEGLAVLTRLSSAHTGDTAFRDFWRDPPDWLSLRDVTFPF